MLIDNAGAAATAVDHLVAAGHSRIGFLGDREELFTARERLRCYRESLARHGIPFDEALVRTGLADAEASNAVTVERQRVIVPTEFVVRGSGEIAPPRG